MGNNNNKILEKDDLYSGFTEGIYYPKRPLRAFKKIKCDDKLCIAELLLSNRIEKKAGYCYPHEGESYPSYELKTKGAYVIKIIGESDKFLLQENIICYDDNGNIYHVDKYFDENITCVSKIE